LEIDNFNELVLSIICVQAFRLDFIYLLMIHIYPLTGMPPPPPKNASNRMTLTKKSKDMRLGLVNETHVSSSISKDEMQTLNDITNGKFTSQQAIDLAAQTGGGRGKRVGTLSLGDRIRRRRNCKIDLIMVRNWSENLRHHSVKLGSKSKANQSQLAQNAAIDMNYLNLVAAAPFVVGDFVQVDEELMEVSVP
jgi:hypothetical protein